LSQTRQELGRWGEKLAAEYLLEHGYAIAARNVRTPYGEIDIIAQQSSESSENETTTVFVEVKTRTSQSFGYPEEAITHRKQANLTSAVQHYLQEHPDLGGYWRIDVIAIEQYPNRAPIISHFENALQ
jgi:putative endonuclease